MCDGFLPTLGRVSLDRQHHCEDNFLHISSIFRAPMYQALVRNEAKKLECRRSRNWIDAIIIEAQASATFVGVCCRRRPRTEQIDKSFPNLTNLTLGPANDKDDVGCDESRAQNCSVMLQVAASSSDPELIHYDHLKKSCIRLSSGGNLSLGLLPTRYCRKIVPTQQVSRTSRESLTTRNMA